MLHNLLNSQPKDQFDETTFSRDLDYSFGREYFDGTREHGYGGYKYDGRWKAIARDVIARYGLGVGSRVLDLGCGKGFFVNDLMEECHGLEAVGSEVSDYGIEHAHGLSRGRIQKSSADAIPFPDAHFDFVSAFNVLHFLTPDRVEVALAEMMRVGKGKSFLQVDSFRNDRERRRLMAWSGGIKTVFSVDEWLTLFARVGYTGDYYWTII
jgi:ubiquinone/menaquinone biosynthesis C-methylase UbiE